MNYQHRPIRMGSYVRWSNPETERVAKGLEDSEECGYWENLANRLVRNTPFPHLYCDGTAAHPDALNRLATELITYFESHRPSFTRNMYADLFQLAAHRVNWTEIAADLARTSIDQLAKELGEGSSETFDQGSPRKSCGLEKLFRATKNILTNRLHPCTWRCRKRKPSQHATQ